MYEIDEEKEKQEIKRRYDLIFKCFRREIDADEKEQIEKAFQLAVEAHANTRRKSGEPYIYHPLEVAHIVVSDIGLGPTSVVCALLHDVVEDTDYTLADIREYFGNNVAHIVDGLTKIDEIFEQGTFTSLQAENFRKMLLTLSEDVRVILIKLADRLHNMRTLDSMSPDKQLKIASETLKVYIPLAHRLGLYTIKSELEDLALRYTEPEIFNNISSKIKESEVEREKFINEFIEPIRKQLGSECIKYSISGRVKSICSIWGKMKKKGVPFKEVYDLFAIRIVLDSSPENEKTDCYKVYSVVTGLYRANPSRLRDWIANPKGNGYEALHTTVMSNTGQWVEVQIRSKRMDEIAERGYAAHWKYKNEGFVVRDSGLDLWLSKIKEMLDQEDEKNAINFLLDFSDNFFSGEIYVYTPKGDVKTLPKGATVLDLAFQIHSDIGFTTIGAKSERQILPINHALKSGTQVEIITSKSQRPKEEWLDYVVSARAKSCIRQWLREEYAKHYEQGRSIVESWMQILGESFNDENIKLLVNGLNLKNRSQFYYRVARTDITIENITPFFSKPGEKHENWFKQLFKRTRNGKEINLQDAIRSQVENEPETMVLGEDMHKLEYLVSNCCHPIPGDDVVGLKKANNKQIEVHRTNCPKAIEFMSQYGPRIIKAKWKKDQAITFLTGLMLKGFDRSGMIKDIVDIVCNEDNVNMRSVSFTATEGVFEGKIMLYIGDTEHLKSLIETLIRIEGLETVERISHVDNK